MAHWVMALFFCTILTACSTSAPAVEKCGTADLSLSGAAESATTTATPLIRKDGTVDVMAISLCNSIVMGNPDGKKRLFVFTDPDCPFCARLHMELVKLIYMEPDLSIYVKIFPLKMHPQAYDKARVILSAADPAYLLSSVFAGEQLPQPGAKDLKGPVDDTIKLGDSLGITGTPTLVFPDGRILPGFKEAAEIKRIIGSTQ